VDEKDMRYFKSFLDNGTQAEACPLAHWVLVDGALLAIEELKAKAMGVRGKIAAAAAGSTGAASKASRTGGKAQTDQTGIMAAEDAEWSFGCLVNCAKQIKQLIGDVYQLSVIDKPTIDLLVLLERTEFVDELSASAVAALDQNFVLDTVQTLEALFRVNVNYYKTYEYSIRS